MIVNVNAIIHGVYYTYDSFYRYISGINLSSELPYSLIRIFVGVRIHVAPRTCTACTTCARRCNPHCRCEQRCGHCNVTKTEFIILTRGTVARNFDNTLDRASQHSLYRSANRIQVSQKEKDTHSLSSTSLKNSRKQDTIKKAKRKWILKYIFSFNSILIIKNCLSLICIHLVQNLMYLTPI